MANTVDGHRSVLESVTLLFCSDMMMTYDDVIDTLFSSDANSTNIHPIIWLLKAEAVMTANITSINIQNLCKGRLHEEAMERVELMSFK